MGRIDPGYSGRGLFLQGVNEELSCGDAAHLSCGVHKDVATPSLQELFVSLLNLFCGFNHHGGAVGKNLGDALHHFGCVIAGANDGVASDIGGVL